MYSHGAEEIQGVYQKEKFIVPAGCAEVNLMIQFPVLIERN